MSTNDSQGGRTVTFYSYKGGTGRSMALANVAWVLACSSRRVLVIDWDLEAPGLHRYFSPFLADKDLVETEGLIDFVWDFTTEAMTPGGEEKQDWFIPLADFRRYAVSLEYDFPSNGAIDVVPAGRQGGDYADRVSSFDWKKFYEQMGGGVFLEAARNRAREDYDYILIDSRTGVSDTSGICTIHLPDLLIVCFTANNQSIKGTAAVAESVREQWAADPHRASTSRRIYPLLTRVDGFERDRLDRRRALARAEFANFLRGSDGLMELPYIPVYSYEETLAVFRDRPEDKEAVLLPGIERLTALITDHEITRLASPPKDVQRRRVLARFEGSDHMEFESVQKVVEASRYDVFLSYSASDRTAVEEVARRLIDNRLQVFFDRQQLTPGAEWPVMIDAVLAASSSVAIFVGPSGLGPWQTKELQVALEHRSMDGAGMLPIIPVFLPGADPDAAQIPSVLRARTWVDFRRSLDEPETFERLLRGIRGAAPTRGADAFLENPYRGLKSFGEESSRFFLGREKLVQQLFSSLQQALQQGDRLLTIIGASGSGKSSLLRAGLVPRLREGALTGSAQWPIAICMPSQNPLESLALAVLGTRSTASTDATDDLLMQVKNATRENLADATMLDRLARQALGETAPGGQLVIIVDQFEDVFRLADSEERQAFLENLLYAAQATNGPVIVVIALRADFYGECLLYPSLAAVLTKHQTVISPMTDEELRETIERPVQILGCEFEAGLVELLISDAKGQPGALPLLQAALAELWERRNGRRLTFEAYQSFGGLRSLLSSRASEVLYSFDEKDRSLCRLILLRLVHVDEETVGMRIRVPLSELIPVSEKPDRVSALIRKLADARLVTVEQVNRTETVEIAHDALIRDWDVLRSWIESSRVGMRTRIRLTEAAREWEGNGRDPSYLYFGTRLGKFREWLNTHRDDLTSLEANFFAVCQSRESRFRILSLDGGGIKGAFTASVMAVLEQDTGKSAADYFDLITGTSTGGIVALGLGLEIPAQDIVNFYREHGPRIFPGTSLGARGFWKQLFGPKHSHAVLKNSLQQIFGERRLGESKCRLVIPTYDANAGRIFLLKTAHHERFKYDHQALAVDVALATSSAPTYFQATPFPNHTGASYVDGGVWANCPALVGLIEAVSMLNISLDQIDILSIGTTSEPFNIAQHATSGIVQWNKGLLDLMFNAQVEVARAQANLLTNGRLHRIDYSAPPGQFSLDDASPEKIDHLINLGRGEAVKKQNLDIVRQRFFNDVEAAPFTPVLG